MEIEDLQEILEVDLGDLTKEFNRIRSIDDSRKRQAAIASMLANDNKFFKKANDHIGDYNSTLKELSDEEEANEHREPLSQFTSKLKQLKENLKALQDETNRELLLQKDAETQVVTAGTVDDKANEAIQKTEGVQGKTIDAIGRMEGTIAESEVLGTTAVSELHRQGDKLGEIGDDLEIMREDIATSRQLIKAIAKELQKDKCWRLIIFVFLLIALVLVIWAAVDPGFGKKTGQGSSGSVDNCQNCNSGTATPRTPI